jgi:hypothetical protein
LIEWADTVPHRSFDPASAVTLAGHLQRATGKLLRDHLNVRADLSKALFYDAALHWRGDLERISSDEPNGVRPAKQIAYLMFWIRKIKPISAAFRESDIRAARLAGRSVPAAKEIVDINERVAILLSFQFLADYARIGQIIIYDPITNTDKVHEYDELKFNVLVMKYLDQKLGSNGKSVLQTLIRDMRYNAFGPHNMVHIMDQFVFGLDRP